MKEIIQLIEMLIYLKEKLKLKKKKLEFSIILKKKYFSWLIPSSNVVRIRNKLFALNKSFFTNQ